MCYNYVSVSYLIAKFIQHNNAILMFINLFINSYEGDFEKFKKPDYTAQDILFTAKDNIVYAICLGWPEESVLIKSFVGVSKSTIKSVTMLGADEDLEWSVSNAGLKIRAPGKKPCEHAFVFKITRK